METSEEVEEVKYGCDHYKRRCKFYTQCCGKFYTCRFCHDENETHSLSRDIVKQIQCTECLEVQPVQRECSGCARVFGKYFCAECRLFDDEDKGQYHCVGCGICRIGGREKFFHCPRCNMCLPRVLENKHQCVENMSRANCPICMEDIHTSRIPSHIPSCGHLIHRVCFDALVRGGHYACPVCQKSMLKMETIWKHMDEEIAATPMPSEYSNYYIGVLCKDCHKECSVLFHPIGSRCEHCGSYNTCRSTNPELSTEPPLVTRPRTTGFGDVIRASFGNPTRQHQSIEVSHEPGPVEENDPSEELD